MKETLGGTLSIWLFLFFFVIYVTFIGVALQFAKIYRVKNYVINTLEQEQFVVGDEEVLSKLDSYLESVPYNDVAAIDDRYCKQNYGDAAFSHHSVCIVPEGKKDNPYYKVVVFFVAEFPFFDIKLTIPASGETKAINIIS